MKIRLLTDSSSDLPLSYINENSDIIELLGMPISIEDEEFIDDLGHNFSHDYFYSKMAEGVMPKTSQINVMTFYDIFLKNHEEGYESLYIGLSSGLSGTYNNANLAKAMAEDEVEGIKIIVIDSVAASIGLGVLIMHTLDLIKSGKSIEEIAKIVEKIKLHANHWFAVDDLMHLKNGGRIPAAVAYVGTMLSVKPILTIKYNGKLESYSSVRGKKKAYKFIAAKAAEHIDLKDGRVLVGHANIQDDAEILESELRKHGVTNEIVKTCLSATIASHVGPGMLAIAFMGDRDREDK